MARPTPAGWNIGKSATNTLGLVITSAMKRPPARNGQGLNSREEKIMSEFETATDTAAFERAINSGDMVIAKFQTKTCFKCRQLEPGLKQVQARATAAVRILDIDAEENASLAERFEVRGVPTLILFKDGHELSRCNGFQSTSMLREWMEPHNTAS
jgi:thioredoxin 1